MGKLTDKIKHYGKIAAISIGGLFISSEKTQQQSPDNLPPNPTELSADIQNDIIDFTASADDIINFDTVSPTQTFQVDTISDPEIIKQINNDTYIGSLGHYNFDTNTTTINYFKGAKNQLAEEDMEEIRAHENAHAVHANTYGKPIGIVTPKHSYSLEIAGEFYGYIHETIHQLNRSAQKDSIIGMHHDTNREFGDILDAGLLQNYQSGDHQDMQELLSVMTNSVFENTYLMVNSDLYEKQLLDAARYNSDITGYPEDIKQENYEQAVRDAFTVKVMDFDGNMQTLNLYDYLTEENKQLLETVAPQHEKEMAGITAETDKLIAENTAIRLTEWDKEAETIAQKENCSKEQILQEFQADFENQARTFTFPGEPQYPEHDAEHHVSEVMTMPEYDTAIHTASADYTEPSPTETAPTETAPLETATDNTLAFLNVQQKIQDLQQRKAEIENLQMSQNIPAPQAETKSMPMVIYRRPEEVSLKKEKSRS